MPPRLPTGRAPTPLLGTASTVLWILPRLMPQVYVVAQRMPQRCSPEQYAVALAQHFVRTYPLVSLGGIAIARRQSNSACTGQSALAPTRRRCAARGAR